MKLGTFKKAELPCYWHEDVVCKSKRDCQSCEYQPDDDDKPNGRKEPVPIAWETDFDNTMPVCPACEEPLYSFERCIFCGQKIIKDEQAKEWEKPPEIERMDCFFCKGKGTMEFTRSRYNGHKHGQCTACGISFME